MLFKIRDVMISLKQQLQLKKIHPWRSIWSMFKKSGVPKSILHFMSVLVGRRLLSYPWKDLNFKGFWRVIHWWNLKFSIPWIDLVSIEVHKCGDKVNLHDGIRRVIDWRLTRIIPTAFIYSVDQGHQDLPLPYFEANKSLIRGSLPQLFYRRKQIVQTWIKIEQGKFGFMEKCLCTKICRFTGKFHGLIRHICNDHG